MLMTNPYFLYCIRSGGLVGYDEVAHAVSPLCVRSLRYCEYAHKTNHNKGI